MNAGNLPSSRLRPALEIIGCFGAVQVLGLLSRRLGDGLWTGVAFYAACAGLVLLYILLARREGPGSLGLLPVSPRRLGEGVLLGAVMFGVQQVPLLLLGMDYSALAAPPQWGRILVMSLYCIFCVGFGEELVFRGFLLGSAQALFRSRWAAVALNCLLFYAFHWPPVRFVFGEFFNITVNTVLLCAYYYRSREKSLLPLMLAHGVYDILSAYLLPAALYCLR